MLFPYRIFALSAFVICLAKWYYLEFQLFQQIHVETKLRKAREGTCWQGADIYAELIFPRLFSVYGLSPYAIALLQD